MSRIRSRNTKPERIVRQFLWQQGFRYRLCSGKLPGRPDIVLPRLKVAIFVNGCFWHGHSSHAMHIPKSNTDYWQRKIEANRARDIENGIRLRAMGWTVLTIWECELTTRRRQATLARLLETLRLLSCSPYEPLSHDDLAVAAEPAADYFSEQSLAEQSSEIRE